jgi:hypothetical protein
VSIGSRTKNREKGLRRTREDVGREIDRARKTLREFCRPTAGQEMHEGWLMQLNETRGVETPIPTDTHRRRFGQRG